jgi:anti-sigma regulatory factor (Ser/Thr protein kinase)
MSPPIVRLELVNRPESVGAVAAALEGVVAVLGLDALDADAVQTAVAEACKNVVFHAYEGTEGPMEVEIRTARDAVAVTVRDRGIGIRPHLGERSYPHNGLGAPIIHQHAWRVTYTNQPGGGTELCMEFAVVPSREGSGGRSEVACAALGRLAGALTGVADARIQVFVGAAEEAEVLSRLREELGADFGRLHAVRLAAEDGEEMVALSLAAAA